VLGALDVVESIAPDANNGLECKNDTVNVALNRFELDVHAVDLVPQSLQLLTLLDSCPSSLLKMNRAFLTLIGTAC
jgi:hypothetical protein